MEIDKQRQGAIGLGMIDANGDVELFGRNQIVLHPFYGYAFLDPGPGQVRQAFPGIGRCCLKPFRDQFFEKLVI